MTLKLETLAARFNIVRSPWRDATERELVLRCPKCRDHTLTVRATLKPHVHPVWQITQDWPMLSLNPSILAWCGAHFNVTNGEITDQLGKPWPDKIVVT